MTQASLLTKEFAPINRGQAAAKSAVRASSEDHRFSQALNSASEHTTKAGRQAESSRSTPNQAVNPQTKGKTTEPAAAKAADESTSNGKTVPSEQELQLKTSETDAVSAPQSGDQDVEQQSEDDDALLQAVSEPMSVSVAPDAVDAELSAEFSDLSAHPGDEDSADAVVAANDELLTRLAESNAALNSPMSATASAQQEGKSLPPETGEALLVDDNGVPVKKGLVAAGMAMGLDGAEAKELGANQNSALRDSRFSAHDQPGTLAESGVSAAVSATTGELSEGHLGPLLQPKQAGVTPELSAQLAGRQAIMAEQLQQAIAPAKHKKEESDSSLAALSAALGVSHQQNAQVLQSGAKPELSATPLQLQREQAAEQLADKVQMMASKNLRHVDIRLDPPELGRMQIRLSVNQDQANVQFHVSNAHARDIVEQAMPRLRELMQQHGMQLAQSSVQQDSSRHFAQQQGQSHQQGQQHSQQQSSWRWHDDGFEQQESAVDMWLSRRRDGIDDYA